MTTRRTGLAVGLAALMAGAAGCPASAPSPGPALDRTAPPAAPSATAPPPPPQGDCRRAAALATRAERLADASERVHVLEQAVQLCDGEETLWRDLGFAYRDSGDRGAARRALERAHALDSSDAAVGDGLDSLGR